ncbi:hypothetical protein AAH979_13170 [Plantactinospora sp. ZYX-F-223]|uniref:hypothetical protein n=1 Tax=Plantactinospora sp. ZYX-F-223 TaxID=3144103 RepID=UPI0031FD5E74
MTEAHPMAETAGRPEARTLAEAYAFVELSLPPGEEWVDFARFTSLHRSGDTYLLRFDGPYQGRQHTIDVVVPVPDASAWDESRLSYGEGRSTLIDAGQWCLLELSSAELARAGLAQLDGAPPDDETYRAIHGAWDAARAAADEVAKFLPAPADGSPPSSVDGAPEDDVVPATACWTTLGQRLRADRPELFRRARLDAARADYQRRLADFVTRYDLPDPLTEPPGPVTRQDPPGPVTRQDPPGPVTRQDSPGPAGGLPAGSVPTVEATGSVPAGAPAAEAVIPVRTFAEAHLYLDLHPCVCGSALFPRGQLDVVRSDDEELLVRYAGPCDGCGRHREFALRLPQRPGVPPESPYQFSYPEDGPSEAIDAGQWLGVAEGYQMLLDSLGIPAGSDEPGERDERGERDEPGADWSGPGSGAGDEADPSWPVDQEEIVRLLVGAASAIDEALRFLPPGGAAVPASAIWTAGGREHHQRRPDQFVRDRLTADRDRHRRRLAGFLARYGR